MRLLLAFALASVVWAQGNKQTTPMIVLPKADQSAGGEIRVMDPTNNYYLSIQTTSNAAILRGKTSGNGNIGFQPGNVPGAASVFVIAPRLDQPSLITFDASGTTTAKTVSLRTQAGAEFFGVVGGTDATRPGYVLTHSLNPLGTADNIGGGIGSGTAYFKGWFEHGDIRESDGLDALYVNANSGGSENAIFAELISGSGQAGRFSTRAASSGDAIRATAAGSGRAIHVVAGGITDDSFAGGGVVAVCADNVGHFVTGACGGTTGFFSRSAPNISPTTANDNIVANGTANIGGTGAGQAWQNGYFDTSMQSPIARITLGPASAVVDYFDWRVGGTSVLDLRDSSANLVFRFNQSVSPVFQFKGDLEPLSSATYDVGASNIWRDLKLSRHATIGDLAGGGTITVCANNAGLLVNSGCSGSLGDPGSNGIVVRTALNTTTARTITSGADITITNGTGVSADPVVIFNPPAFTTYTPSTSNLSSVSASGRYHNVGKWTLFEFSVIGTPSANPVITLPIVATAANTFVCTLTNGGAAFLGWGVVLAGSQNLTVSTYNNTAFGGVSSSVVCNGIYESN